jgi:Ca2+-binding EF-hand superfamily protein
MSVSRSWQDAEEIRGAFRLFDTDSSGTITPEELMAILTRPNTGNSLSLADAKEIIASFDTDG